MNTPPKPVVVMVVAPEQFRDEELLVPRQAFLKAGLEVLTVSTKTGEGVGMLGHREVFSQTVRDVYDRHFDAVVVVGGYGSVEHLWHHAEVFQLIQKANQAEKIIAAICVSPVVLANSGVLKGRKATVWDMPEAHEAFQAAKVIYTGETVTVDGRYITASGPEASQVFSDSVLMALNGLAE